MPAILFGSIGTIADTSEIQRQAFNDAFRDHGLDWQWDQDDYRTMLEGSGGADRIAEYARAQDQQVDAQAIHATKSDLFQQALAAGPVAPRDGVADAVRQAKDAGIKVALVTTTSSANIDALMQAVQPDLDASDFDLVVDTTSVEQSKPDPASYRFALDQLGEQAGDCVAIEDNVGGVESAAAADLRCVAFPNQNTAGHDFDGADQRVDAVDFATLQQMIGSN